MTTEQWIYPSSLEELNAALQAEQIERLQYRTTGNTWFDAAVMGLSRTPNSWRDLKYRYTLKESETMTTKRAAYLTLQANSDLNIDDIVEVIAPNIPPETLGFDEWTERHQRHVGHTYRIISINTDGIDLGVLYFPFFALRVTRKAPKRLRIADHDVTINRNGSIKFGCTTIPLDEVQIVFAAWEKTKESQP